MLDDDTLMLHMAESILTEEILFENTALIKVTEDKHKYINLDFKKINQKIYDYTCDVKLIIQKEIFRAHKDVLAAASDYFCAMFSHNMKEKTQDSIEFKDISSEGFFSMLEYFYHGYITIEPNNVEAILENARFFHIEWLVSVCTDFLIRHLSLEDYENVLQLADQFYLGDLSLEIHNFFGHNFHKLADKFKFSSLSYELFNSLLTNNYFVNAPEFFIFQAVLRWLQFDDQRISYKVPLLKSIRYTHFDETQLSSLPEYVLEEPELYDLIEEANDCHANPFKQCILSSDKTDARGSNDVIMLISAFEDAHLIQYKIDSSPNYYESPINTSFLDSIFEFSCITQLGNFIFVAGGYNRSTWCSTNLVYRFNPRDQSWAEITSMCLPRVSFALCSTYKGLYAIAGINHIVENGIDRDIYLDSAEYYDPMSGIWKSVPSLDISLCSLAASANEDIIFVSGGISDNPEENVPVSHLISYNPGDSSWKYKSPMFKPRQGHAMVSGHRTLYVFGGYTSGSNSMSFSDCLEHEMYNIDTDQWTKIIDNSLDFNHIYNTSCILTNDIYLLAGDDYDKYLLKFDVIKQTFDEKFLCDEQALMILNVRMAFPFDVS